MEKYQLQDTTKYQRDRHSKAILSGDSGGLIAYKAAKKRVNEMRSHGEDINKLKEELSEIKNLLKQILEQKQ